MSWTKVFDAESNSHYYWNEETDETTWDKPDDFVDQEPDKEEPVEPAVKPTESEQPASTSAQDEEFYKSQEYYNWYYQTYYPAMAGQTPGTTDNPADPDYKDYSISGYFNSRTGKFQSANFDAKFNASTYFADGTKAERQMSVFFDPRKLEERGALAKDPLKKPTKKEVEKFKMKKQQKKLEKAIKKYAD
jgi:hypothetical protein